MRFLIRSQEFKKKKKNDFVLVSDSTKIKILVVHEDNQFYDPFLDRHDIRLMVDGSSNL